jgi:hypothetical protein
VSVKPNGQSEPLVAKKRLIFIINKEAKMPLINVVIVLIVVGVILWLINQYIPMDSKIKSILNVVVIIGVALWLLSAFGVIGSISTIRIGS